MADTKPKKSTDKFFDVAKPGKSAPSATSRPVIITNRPVLKDPMVIRVDTGEQEAPSTAAVKDDGDMKHKIDIKPLHIDLESVLAPGAPAVKKSTKKAETKKQDEATTVEDTPEPETAEEATEEQVPEEPATVEEETTATETPEPKTEPTKEEATPPASTAPRVSEKVIAPPTPEETTTEEPEKPAETHVEESPAPEAPAETDDSSFGSEESEPSLDNSDTPVLSEKETKAAAAAKKIAEEQEKIINSGEFYLPINSVEKRRAKHHIILGTVLVFVLITIAVLAAWDAGVFSIHGYTPPTNFL